MRLSALRHILRSVMRLSMNSSVVLHRRQLQTTISLQIPRNNQPLDFVVSATIFTFLQRESCLLLCMAVFTYKAWTVATKNLLIGAADVHIVHSEVKKGIVRLGEA